MFPPPGIHSMDLGACCGRVRETKVQLHLPYICETANDFHDFAFVCELGENR